MAHLNPPLHCLSANRSGNTLRATSRSSFVSLGLIHLAHAARADLFDDAIVAEGLADHELLPVGAILRPACRPVNGLHHARRLGSLTSE